MKDGWREENLSELMLALETGSRPKGGVTGILNGIVSIGGEHLTNKGGFDFTKIKYVSRDFADKMNKGLVKKDDILIVKDGATTGKCSFVGNDFPFDFAVVNEHVFICRISYNHYPKYIFYYLYSNEGQNRILENFQGSAQGGINRKFAENTLIPLPPTINEQRRIVARLEALLSRLNSTRDRLDKIPAILRRFRQSVLSAACSGRLTAEWREGKELPEWEEASSSKIFEYVTSGSRGWAKYYSDSGAIFIRIGNLNRNTIELDFNKIQYVIPPKDGEGTRTKIKKDDILISITAELGMIGYVDDEKLNAYINQHIALARPKKGYNARYLAWILASKNVFDQLTAKQRGATKIGLGLDDIRSLTIPIPPLSEQEEIVRRVDAFFTLADSIEQRYNTAKATLARAEKAVYKKAFGGEL